TYTSRATNLVPGFIDGNGVDINSGADVFLFDRVTGVNTLVDRANGTAAQGSNNTNYFPAISGDGRFVAVFRASTDLVSGFVAPFWPAHNVFLFDRLTASNRLVSHGVTQLTSGNSYSYTPEFSGDGTTIYYNSEADNLAPGDFNSFEDVFWYS